MEMEVGGGGLMIRSGMGERRVGSHAGGDITSSLTRRGYTRERMICCEPNYQDLQFPCMQK